MSNLQLRLQPSTGTWAIYMGRDVVQLADSRVHWQDKREALQAVSKLGYVALKAKNQYGTTDRTRMDLVRYV